MVEILAATKLVEFALTVASATISPGPNFLMVVRCSAHHTRMAGVMMALGMGVGMVVHCSLILLGLSVIFNYYPPLIKIIQFLGVGFLVYMAAKSIFSRSKASTVSDGPHLSNRSSSWEGFQQGFLTHITNPFPFLFIMSTLSLFRSPIQAVNIAYASVAVLIEFGWYAFVALVLTSPHAQKLLIRHRRVIDIIAGVLLFVIAIKLARADVRI